MYIFVCAYIYITIHVLQGNVNIFPICRYDNSLSTGMCWQQSADRCRCIPAGQVRSDLGDNSENEEVRRDPRASFSSLAEEAQVVKLFRYY